MKCSSCDKKAMDLKKCVCEKVYYCGVSCQKSHWKSHRPNCPNFVIKDFPGKGWGMIAARTLKPGTVILSEKPILLMEHPTVTKDLQNDYIVALLNTFDNLLEKDKRRYLGLKDSSMIEKENVPGVILGIYMTNGLGITDNKTGVYETISRINHSCAPNAQTVATKENENLKEVRAFVKIEKGEEILISYINLEKFVQRDDRRKDLAKWNFLCSCKVCSLTGEELLRNEVARKNIQDYHLNMLKYWNDSFSLMGKMKALDLSQKKLDMVLAMRSEMPGQVFACYLDCYALSCIVAKMGGQLKTEPSVYAEKAEKMSQMMGYGFQEKYCSVMEKYT